MSSITVPNPANGCFLSRSSRLRTGCSVTHVLLLYANLQVLPPAKLSSCTPEISPTISTLRWLDLMACVHASSMLNITLAWCFACASVEVAVFIAALVLPEGLIAAHDWVDCFPSRSFAFKLVTGEGRTWIAPRIHGKTVVTKIVS